MSRVGLRDVGILGLLLHALGGGGEVGPISGEFNQRSEHELTHDIRSTYPRLPGTSSYLPHLDRTLM